MKTKIKVLLAGRCKKAISDLKDLMTEQERLDVTLRHIVNGHADPLYGLEEAPDLLVMHVNGLEGGEIEALIERPATARPPCTRISAKLTWPTGSYSVLSFEGSNCTVSAISPRSAW